MKIKKKKNENSYYIEAKCKLADIYLKYKNNKKAYALCYQEILENNPTTEVKVLLADAYMNIQEVYNLFILFYFILFFFNINFLFKIFY